MRTGHEEINESLTILFSTRNSERRMAPAYGVGLDRLLFEPLDAGLEAYMERLITNAILRYETRIQPNEIQLELDNEGGTVLISITYTIRATNSRFNFVFPYYLDEGVTS